jgi:sec-independent protein translocase protein TatA
MGHWVEILAILVLALLVFGPKRMVDMGSSLGKAFREFRDSTKDINFSDMLNGGSDDEDDSAARITPITVATPHIVEGSIERPSPSAAPDTSDAADIKIVPTTSEAQPK